MAVYVTSKFFLSGQQGYWPQIEDKLWAHLFSCVKLQPWSFLWFKLYNIALLQGFVVPKESQNKVAKFPILWTPAHLRHSDVVIAAITSCINTSNPSVMLGAALVAKKACELGLQVSRWLCILHLHHYNFMILLNYDMLGQIICINPIRRLSPCYAPVP